MGCQCLGPKKSLEQVYIKMIKQIHQQAKKMSITQIKNPNFHNQLIERLVKKGQLRKLNDNLSSRRNKIQDAMTLNYKLTSQTKQQYSCHAGLIITDSIIQVVYLKKPYKVNQNLGQTQISDNFILGKNQSTSKSNETRRLNVSNLSKQSVNIPIIGIDEQYLKIIMFLFESDNCLKQKLYKSLNKFCDRHPGIINRQSDVWKLIGIVIKDIGACDNIEKQKRCQLFKKLLLKTRQQCSEDLKNSAVLQSLFYLWLSSRKSLDQSTISNNCMIMLSVYFNRFISAWESEFIYQNIFAIFDQIQFDKVDQSLVQKLCEDLVQDMQLKEAFQRSMFNYLLGYMSIMQQNASAKKWLMNSLGINIENIRILYKNPTKPNVKVECFKRMNSWISKKYVDINQFCLYNSKAIVHVYTSNLSIFNSTNMQNIHKQILNQFNITFSHLNKQSKIKFIETCVQQFQSSDLLIKQYEQIIIIIRQIINSRIINKSEISSLCFCLPIDYTYDAKKKLEIIRLNMFLLDLIDPHLLNNQERNRFAESMYTLYQNIINDKSNFNQRYQFLQSSINYLGNLQKKIGKEAFVVYYSHLCEKSQQSSRILSIQSQLCLLILGFNIRKIITGLALPEKLSKLKKSIQQKINKQSSLSEINHYFFNKDIIVFDIAPPFRSNNDQIEQYKKIFSFLFNMNQNEKIQSIIQRRESFTKQTSNLSQSSNREYDRSFQDVLDVISNI